MYCPNCGEQIVDRAKCCTNCGVKLIHNNTTGENEVKTAETPESECQTNEKRKPRRKKHWLLWLLVFLIIVSVFVLYFLPSTRNLYVYSDIEYSTSQKLSAADKAAINEFKRVIEGSFVFYSSRAKEYYIVFDLEDFIGGNINDLIDSDDLDVEFRTTGSAAIFYMIDPDSSDAIKITFRKPTINERIYFISKLLSNIKETI